MPLLFLPCVIKLKGVVPCEISAQDCCWFLGWEMIKLMRLLSILAVALLSIDSAAAFSFTSGGSGTATGTSEDVVFSYSAASPFTLSGFTFSQPSTGNLLGGAFSPFITPAGSNLSGTGTLSEIVSTTPGKAYGFSYTINPLANATIATGVSVSAVPLPASFPLFAMALIGLGVIGYRTARANSRLAS
jgi:hypothetical protein